LEFPRRVVLDSSVIVGVLRNKNEDVRIVRELEAKAKIATTTINAFEVYYEHLNLGILNATLWP